MSQLLIVTGIAVATLGWLAFALIDRLEGIERTCKSELLKTERMATASDLFIDKHYDFWTKKLSGGGWITPWVSEPYVTPKVLMEIRFVRDGQEHWARIECHFSKVPNSGDPPQVIFDRVDFQADDVLDEKNRRVPWPPKRQD